MTQTAHLQDRALFRISGHDTIDFLHNLITCDVLNLAVGTVTFGALLTPQGKVLFDFHILREADAFLFDVEAINRDALMKRLTFYKLRAEVSIDAVDDIEVFAQWPLVTGSGDGRREEMGTRDYTEMLNTTASQQDWHEHRMDVGIPLSGIDFKLGDVFAHDVLMDQFSGGGVDFSKGCYVGQEVVSRMKHRDSARNRFVKISAKTPLPPQGTPITVSDRQVGTMGSSIGTKGLALVRIDKIGKALSTGNPVLTENAPVRLELPEFVTFDWGQ